MHNPLKFLFVPGIALAVLAAAWGVYDLIGEMESSWFWAGLGLLATLIVWAAVSAKGRAIARNVAAAFQAQPLKGVGVGLLLTIAYALVAYAFMGPLRSMLQETLLVDRAWVTGIAVILGLVAAAPLIVLYKPTGIPVDESTVRRSGWALAVLVLVVVGYITHERPNRFFDLNTGQPTFMVAEEEGRVYHLDPEECRRNGCFSPSTGERLRPGTPTDARRYAQQPWSFPIIEKVGRFFGGNSIRLAKDGETGEWGALLRSNQHVLPFTMKDGHKVRLRIEKNSPAKVCAVVTYVDNTSKRICRVPGKVVDYGTKTMRKYGPITTDRDAVIKLIVTRSGNA